MSTRCQIAFYKENDAQIEKPDILLYRHSDGYPGTLDGKEYGVLVDICPFLIGFNKRRGISDTEYVAARLLQYLCNQHDSQVGSPYGDTLGLGISWGFHGDIEFLYCIFPDRLEVHRPDMDWDSDKLKGSKLLNSWTWEKLIKEKATQ